MSVKVGAAEFAKARTVIGFDLRTPDLAAAGVVVLTGLVADLQAQNRALAARVDALEAAHQSPPTLRERFALTASRILG